MRTTRGVRARPSLGRHALSGLARQFHAKLFALAVAQDRQVNDFTFLSVFDRFSKIGDISFGTSFDSIL